MYRHCCIYGAKAQKTLMFCNIFSGGNKMKKHFRIIAALLASVMLMGLMLSGCGKAEPTVEDAKKYVDSTVKLLCTGEYDKSVKFSDIEEG